MNRAEALKLLGLDEDATTEDVKIAYKETVQILHPDRFAGNKKLQDRATEQFKNLQEAYDFLTSGKGSRAARSGARSRGGASGAAATGSRVNGYTEADEIEARLAGIAAARVQLVVQRDKAVDERQRGIIAGVVGALVALVCGRKLGLLAVLAGIGGTAVVWGIIQAISAQRTIGALTAQLDELNEEKKKLLKKLEDFE